MSGTQPANGIRKVRSEFGEWHQNKSSFPIAGMRNRQVRKIDDPLLIQQDVNIKRPRSVPNATNAAGQFLNVEAFSEKVLRFQQCSNLDNGVQKPGLGLQFPRLGLVKRRTPPNGHTPIPKGRHGKTKLCFAIP